MRPEMFLRLLHHVDFAESAVVGHLLRLDVLWREIEFLGVHQQDSVLTARLDHEVCLFEGHTQGLFTNHVFPSRRRVARHLCVQRVRDGDGDHLQITLSEHGPVIGKKTGNLMLACEPLGVAGRRRGNRHDLGLFRQNTE